MVEVVRLFPLSNNKDYFIRNRYVYWTVYHLVHFGGILVYLITVLFISWQICVGVVDALYGQNLNFLSTIMGKGMTYFQHLFAKRVSH